MTESPLPVKVQTEILGALRDASTGTTGPVPTETMQQLVRYGEARTGVQTNATTPTKK